LDASILAAGIADAYWELRLKPWDMAAGVLIAREAGATVTTMDGRPFSVFSRSVLAATGGIHGSLLEKIKPKTEELRARGIDLSPWFVPKGYSVPELGE
jgi:myo-inositol-1(or 4)-monophosphatase